MATTDEHDGSNSDHDFVMVSATEVDDQTERSPRTAEEIDEIRQWLKPTGYCAEGSEYQKHWRSRVPGTGAWIYETKEYSTWHDSSDVGALWIKAIQGAGKECAHSLTYHSTLTSGTTRPRSIFSSSARLSPLIMIAVGWSAIGWHSFSTIPRCCRID
jgi:hypothetical protein